jgi:phosphoribosylformimino-5-aminoimidazole carboxamide ribotide isomerase
MMAQRYFDVGVGRIILGPIAYQKPAFAQEMADRFPGKIGIEFTVENRRVVIKGWTVAAHKTASDYLERFRDMGFALSLYSDVNEHGVVTPENLGRVRAFTSEAQMPVIHGADLESLEQLEPILHLEKALITMTKEHELRDSDEDSTIIAD